MPSIRLATMEVTVRKSALGRMSLRSPSSALLAIGAERPRLASASSEVKFASAPPSSGVVKSVLPSTIAPAFTASRLARRAVVIGCSAVSSLPLAWRARRAGIA